MSIPKCHSQLFEILFRDFIYYSIILINIQLIIAASFTTFSNALPWDVVPEGHRGIYYRFGGKLLETVTHTGMYLKMPYSITMASEI